MYYIMSDIFKHQLVLFLVMFVIGVVFNDMNMMAYRFNDVYLSLTLIYSGLFMASNMIWGHQIVHYITMGHFDAKIFSIGVLLSIGFVLLLRNQVFVNATQWLRQMIGHHSSAITSTTLLLENDDNFKNNNYLFTLAKNIAYEQDREILMMKNML